MAGKKITIEEIESIFLSYGYSLEEKEYKGHDYKYKIKDSAGYLYRSTYTSLKEGYTPQKFHSRNPFTIANIGRWLSLENHPYYLLDKEYKNSQTKMTWIDRIDTEKIHKATWNQIQSGSLSRIDASKKIAEAHMNKSKRKGSSITEEILELLGKKHPEWSIDGDINSLYKGVDEKIPVINNKGYKSEISSSSLKAGYIPSLFKNGNVHAKTFNMYKKVKEDTEYILKEGQKFTAMYDEYTFICSIHGEFVKTLGLIIISDGYCPRCLQDRMRGEKSPNWKQEKSKEERIKERKNFEYTHWRDSVFERDDFRCSICSERGHELHAHHKDGYHWCEDRRYDINNGVTLCMYCHRMYHSKYGSHNAKDSDWVEWEAVIHQLIRENKQEFDSLRNTFIEKESEVKTKRKLNREEGVGWREDQKKWRVRIKVDGKWKSFGTYKTEDDAIEAKHLKIKELRKKGVI